VALAEGDARAVRRLVDRQIPETNLWETKRPAIPAQISAAYLRSTKVMIKIRGSKAPQETRHEGRTRDGELGLGYGGLIGGARPVGLEVAQARQEDGAAVTTRGSGGGVLLELRPPPFG